MREPVISYFEQVKANMKFTSFDTAMRRTILNMVHDEIDEKDGLQLINDMCWHFAKDPGIAYINHFSDLLLWKGNVSPAPTPEPELPGNFPDPMNVEQFAKRTSRSVSWCRNHTKLLPKTQRKPGCKMTFFKADVDRWLAKHLNKEAK